MWTHGICKYDERTVVGCDGTIKYILAKTGTDLFDLTHPRKNNDGCGNIGVGGDGGVEGRTKDGTAEDTNITMATNENDKIKSENKVISLPPAVVYATLQGLSIEGVQLTSHTGKCYVSSSSSLSLFLCLILIRLLI